MTDVLSYLESLCLDHIAPAFQENAVDGPALMELTQDELVSELKCSILQARKIKGGLPAIESMPQLPF